MKKTSNNLPKTSNNISNDNPQRIKKDLKQFTSVFSPTLFIRYPYFVSASTKIRKRELTYTGKESNGTKIADVKWEIEALDYLSGEMEYKVWYWLLYKLSLIPKPLSPNFCLPYTLSEIAKFWNLKKCGRILDLIKKAIKNLRTTNIHYWKQIENENPDDLSFTILTDRIGKGDKTDDTLMNRNILYLSKALIVLINEYQLKPLNGETLKELIDKSIVSARLYEILGWRYYTSQRSKRVKFTYNDLIKRIGLPEQKYLSDAKRQFNKAFKYLRKTRTIIDNPEWNKVKDTWILTFDIGEGLKLETFEFGKRIEGNNKTKQLRTYQSHSDLDEAMNLISEVIEIEGNNKEVYKHLVNKILNRYPNGLSNVCMAISNLKQEARKDDINNPSGYLYSLLQNFMKQ